MQSFTFCFAALAAAALVVAGCGNRPRPRDLVFVTLDSVRADRIGTYGCPHARTPVIDRWARGGALVRDCIVDVPLTLPSHASMMTGRHALAHGVRINGEWRLNDAAPTLAEALTAQQFATGAIVSSIALQSIFGLAQGFASYDDSLSTGYAVQDEARFPRDRQWLPKRDRRADEAVEKGTAWLEGRRGGRERLFIWLHLNDAHFPYDPPRPWEGACASLYDAEIAVVDRELVRLARVVDRAELSRPNALVVTADHGEGLGDHGEDEHGIFVYDEMVRVPLVVKAAGVVPVGSILDAQVRTIDLAATMLELACGRKGGSRDGDVRFGDGGSLVAALAGRGAVPDTIAYSESIQSKISYSGSGVKARRTRAMKVIASARPEHFDLLRDPGERAGAAATAAELSGVRAEVERALRLESWAEQAAADEETMDMLRNLGDAKVGRASAMPRTLDAEMRFDGFDPRDLVYASLAGRDLEIGLVDRAEAKLARFFAMEEATGRRPENAPLRSLAHQNAARAAMSREEYVRAAGEFERALAEGASNSSAAEGIVYAWNLAGQPDVAEKRARELMRAHPTDERIRLHHGLALALTNRREQAIMALTHLANESKDSELAGVAAIYAEKLGGPESGNYLEIYLGAETHAIAGESQP